MERSPLFIQSFDKVMRVLEAFSQTEQYLGLGEIVALTGFEDRIPEIAIYDDETDEQRLARRMARWTPTVLVEAQPSA